MSRLILVLSCFVLLVIQVNGLNKEENTKDNQDETKANELGRQLDDIIKPDNDKTAEMLENDLKQEATEEEDASHVNAKRSTRYSSYSRILPNWMTLDHLANSLVRVHLRGMIIKKMRQERQAKAELDRMKSDDCNGLVITSVGKPVVHNTYGTYQQGVWMKDPLEYLGPGKIWILTGTGNNKVEEFASYKDFKAGIVHKTRSLPYNWDGTGAVVYGPYLYYNRQNTRYIVKYDLTTDQVVKQVTHTYYYPKRSYNYYSWGGNSGMDLAVDESGLWVLSGYSSYSYRLAASKINPTTMATRTVYSVGGKYQRSMGNAFVACGVVYTVDSYSGKPTKISRAYDTATGKSWNPNLRLTWQFGYGTSLDYNPKEKMLYAYDNYHQVTYSLKFGKKI